MEQANKLYLQYLEDAQNLAKVGQDELTLRKAGVFAQIAQAIAATGLVEKTVFEEAPVNEAPVKEEPKTNVKTVTGKASLERKPEPKKVTGTAPAPEKKPDHTKALAYLESDAYKNVKTMEEEPEEMRKLRYGYLIDQYGTQTMKDLPQEEYEHLKPEIQAIADFKYYLGQWKANVDQWMVKVATESSDNRVTSIAELTVSEYLARLMPAMLHLDYLLSFVQDGEALMDILSRVSRGQIKKLEDIRLRNIDFIRTGVDSVLNGTFDAIEKVS